MFFLVSVVTARFRGGYPLPISSRSWDSTPSNRDLPRLPSYYLGPVVTVSRDPLTGRAIPPASHRSPLLQWLPNINGIPIGYTFRSHLRHRLTLLGRTFSRKPWVYGEDDLHILYATRAGILASISSITSFDITSMDMERPPTTVLYYTVARVFLHNPWLRWIS